MNQKESFVFYETFWEQLKDLDDKLQLRFLGNIIEYGLYNKNPDGLTKLELALWKTFKYAIDNAKARRAQNIENGRKGGRPCVRNMKNSYEVSKTTPLEIIEKSTCFNTSEKPKITENNPEKPTSNLNVNVDVDGNVDENVNGNVNVDENVNGNVNVDVDVDVDENVNGNNYERFSINFHEDVDPQSRVSQTFYLHRQKVNLDEYELDEKEKIELERDIKKELQTLLERTHNTDKQLGLVLVSTTIYGQDQFINFRTKQELKRRSVKLKTSTLTTTNIESKQIQQEIKEFDQPQSTYNPPKNTSYSSKKDTNIVKSSSSLSPQINKKPLQPCRQPTKTFKFQKPSIDEIRNYCNERHNGIEAIVFYDFYESVGWKVGKSDMYSWQAAIRTWEHRKNQKEKEEAKKIADAHDFSQETIDRFFASA